MADDAYLSAILRGFGPDAPSSASDPDASVAMPEDVWARLQASIQAEAAHRAAFPPVASAPDDELSARRNSRRTHSRRWATGLVAASAVVLAGVVVTAVTRTGDPTPLASSAAELGAPAAMASAALLAPPAQVITHTDTDYSVAGLGDKVHSLMEQAGVTLPGQQAKASTRGLSADGGAGPMADAVPMALAVPGLTMLGASGDSGLPSLLVEPMQRLTDCVSTIAANQGAQALVIDLSTYDGQPASIVVLTSHDGQRLFVNVVDLNCQAAVIAEIPTDAEPGMAPRLIP